MPAPERLRFPSRRYTASGRPAEPESDGAGVGEMVYSIEKGNALGWCQPPARHSPDPGIMQFRHDRIHTVGEILVPYGGNGFGKTEQVDAEVEVVHEEVKHAASA